MNLRRHYPSLFQLALLLALAACGTSDYVRADRDSPYGYLDRRIDRVDYTIVARGMAQTPPQRVVDIVYLRAARLTLAQGAAYFVILHEQTGRLRPGQKTPLEMPIAPHITVGSTGEPMAMLLIRLLPANAPPVGVAYDARAMSQHLGQKLGVD
jgi:predicted small lipoprotein YifL